MYLDKNSVICINVQDQCSGAEMKGAYELLKYMYETAGSDIRVGSPSISDSFIVFIGSAADPYLKFQFDSRKKNLGNEGIFIGIKGNKCLLSGNTSRAILYAVYTFLEDFFGIRWFTESLTVIPETERVEIADCIRTFVPKMNFRQSSFKDGTDPSYCAHNRINAGSELTDEFGGRESFVPGAFVHTLSSIIPQELFETHPEYFPLIDGERVCGPYRQRCLTNPDVRRIAKEWTKKMLSDHPDSNIISVSQNDTFPDDPGICTCPQCRAINDREESLSGTMIDFVNEIADSVRDEFPGKMIETLAYRFTRQAPKTLVPRDNVLIRLCSIECCFSHPIRECGWGTGSFSGDIRDWSRISKQLFVWDYVTDFAFYLLPHPNIHVLQDNIRLFEENRVIGYYPEGAHNGRGAEMSELKAYLLARLSWDSDFDCEKGTEEFINAFCGKGAPYILKYLKRIRERVINEQVHWSTFQSPDPAFFTPEFLKEISGYFRDAASVEQDKTILGNIRKLELSVRFVRLWLYPKDFASKKNFEEAVDVFLSDCVKYGVDRINECLLTENSPEILKKQYVKEA